MNDNRFPTRTPLDNVTVPTSIDATSQLRSRFDFGGLTVISVTSRLMAHDIGTVILKNGVLSGLYLHNLKASISAQELCSAKLGFAFMY